MRDSRWLWSCCHSIVEQPAVKGFAMKGSEREVKNRSKGRRPAWRDLKRLPEHNADSAEQGVDWKWVSQNKNPKDIGIDEKSVRKKLMLFTSSPYYQGLRREV